MSNNDHQSWVYGIVISLYHNPVRHVELRVNTLNSTVTVSRNLEEVYVGLHNNFVSNYCHVNLVMFVRKMWIIFVAIWCEPASCSPNNKRRTIRNIKRTDSWGRVGNDKSDRPLLSLGNNPVTWAEAEVDRLVTRRGKKQNKISVGGPCVCGGGCWLFNRSWRNSGPVGSWRASGTLLPSQLDISSAGLPVARCWTLPPPRGTRSPSCRCSGRVWAPRDPYKRWRSPPAPGNTSHTSPGPFRTSCGSPLNTTSSLCLGRCSS